MKFKNKGKKNIERKYYKFGLKNKLKELIKNIINLKNENDVYICILFPIQIKIQIYTK